MSAIAARRLARRQRMLQSIARHAVLIGVGFVFVSPFVFVIFTALMTRDQALTRAIWPSPFRLSNFYDVLSQQPLLRWTWNTFLVSFLSSIGVVLSCAPPAYALARMRFRGRNAVFLLVLSTMMLPIQVTIIPLYVLFSHIGWIGSLKPLIIPGFFGDAFEAGGAHLPGGADGKAIARDEKGFPAVHARPEVGHQVAERPGLPPLIQRLEALGNAVGGGRNLVGVNGVELLSLAWYL